MLITTRTRYFFFYLGRHSSGFTLFTSAKKMLIAIIFPRDKQKYDFYFKKKVMRENSSFPSVAVLSKKFKYYWFGRNWFSQCVLVEIVNFQNVTR